MCVCVYLCICVCAVLTHRQEAGGLGGGGGERGFLVVIFFFFVLSLPDDHLLFLGELPLVVDHVGSAPKEKKKRFLPDPFNTPGSGRSVGVSVEGDKSGLRTRGRTSGGLLEGGVKVEGEGELGQPVKVQNERTVVLGGRHRMRGKRAARGSNQQRSQSRRLSVEGRVRRRPVDNLELSWEGIGRVEGEDTAGQTILCYSCIVVLACHH